jgi:ABC-type nitrate/sulfonate/bicarbonate transport system substrate-binding protein
MVSLKGKRTRTSVVAASLTLVLLVAGCSGTGDNTSSRSTTTESQSGSVADNDLLAKYDVAIPGADLSLGLMPYADHMAPVIANDLDWFEEVGINVKDKRASLALDQLQALTLDGTYDMTSNYIPDQLRNWEAAPNVKFLGIFDATTGTAVLAPPNSQYETIKTALEKGMSWDDAAKKVMAQMANKSFGMEDVGAHRGFIDPAMKAGGITFEDLGELKTAKDPQLLLMANGGQLDFVLPQGGAAEALLINQGWYPIIEHMDLVRNLPPGDPDAVAGIGSTGISLTKEFYDANHDTSLRVAGVMFRVIDAIRSDLENGNYDHIKLVAPVLSAAASTDITPEDLLVVYRDVGPFVNFEEQEEYWVDEESPLYYKTVYDVQIDLAREGGAVSDPDMNAEGLADIAEEVYKEMKSLKEEYEAMLPEASEFDGDQAKLVEIAKRHFENRNYLDANRILTAAVTG